MTGQFIEHLYQKSLTGDTDAQTDLFDALSARFNLIAQKRIWDSQDAQEVAQDALMTVFVKYKELPPDSSFTPWAYAVLRNKILDHIRTKLRRGATMILSDTVDQFSGPGVPDPELEQRLKGCLKKIMSTNIRYARILVRIYQGYSAEEICAVFRVTRSNLYSILSRARSLLKRCLEAGDSNP